MKICIYGAGSIGCYLGGRLAVAGYDVDFIVRPKIQQQLEQYGLTVSDYLGEKNSVPASTLELGTDPNIAAQSLLISHRQK